jgi:hypothetical protein
MRDASKIKKIVKLLATRHPVSTPTEIPCRQMTLSDTAHGVEAMRVALGLHNAPLWTLVDALVRHQRPWPLTTLTDAVRPREHDA